MGTAATPISPAFTETEAAYQITDADADLAIVADGSVISTSRAKLVVDVLRSVPHASLPDPVTAEPDLALLIYASGSTGKLRRA